MGDAAGGPLFGRGAAVLVSGEGGIGKTRLIDHALAAAAELGMAVRRARAEEFDGRRPFRAMAAALGIAADAAEPERRELAGLLAGGEPDQTEPRLVEAMVAVAGDDPHQARASGRGTSGWRPAPSGMSGLAWLSG